MKVSPWWCSVSVVGALMLAGCTGSDSGSPEEDPQVQRSDVLGSWQSTPPGRPDGLERRVTFADDGTWRGSLDGCNSQSGTWAFDASSRSMVFDDVASTLVGCADPETGEPSATADSAEVSPSAITLLDGATTVGELTRVDTVG